MNEPQKEEKYYFTAHKKRKKKKGEKGVESSGGETHLREEKRGKKEGIFLAKDALYLTGIPYIYIYTYVYKYHIMGRFFSNLTRSCE